MLGYCGLKCDNCPIFLATVETDKSKKQSMRESIAKVFFENYNIKMLPEEISDCDGCCTTSDCIFPGCYKCKVRICAKSKNLESCAYCENYICTKLNELFILEPDTKNRLEEIRNTAK